MPYIPLLDPFTIQFEKDGWDCEAKITYVKSIDSCCNFFNVMLLKPEGTEPFYLKEKPTPGTEFTEMVWVDENDKITLFYQIIGEEIEKNLRKNQGIFLIDAPVHNHEDDSLSVEDRD